MVALHGYADDSRLFEKLGHTIPADVSLLAVDLPWHGQSEWGDKLFLADDFEELCERLRIQKKAASLHLLGFSLGGRYCLSGLLQKKTIPVDSLILLAPDGLSTLWQGVTDRMSLPLREKIDVLLQRPSLAIRLAALLQRLRLISRFTFLFLQKNLTIEKFRQRLFKTWQSVYFFPLTGKSLQEINCPVLLILGKKDGIVNGQKIAKQARGNEQVELHWVNSGHRLVAKKETIEIIVFWLHTIIR